jgi:hypothetical protein
MGSSRRTFIKQASGFTTACVTGLNFNSTAKTSLPRSRLCARNLQAMPALPKTRHIGVYGAEFAVFALSLVCEPVEIDPGR